MSIKNYKEIVVGPNIVQSGLIISLDIANAKSYPGSGNIVYDLSGNNYNATLSSGSVYSSLKNGYVGYTPGVTSGYIYTEYTPPADTFTISVISQRTDSDTFWAPLISADHWYAATGFTLYFNSANVLQLNLAGGLAYAFSMPSQFSRTNFNFYTLVKTPTTAYVYINDILALTQNTTFVAPTQVLSFGARHANNGIGYTDPRPGYYAGAFVYNRALSQAEVVKNFNAMRSRYGI